MLFGLMSTEYAAPVDIGDGVGQVGEEASGQPGGEEAFRCFSHVPSVVPRQ